MMTDTSCRARCWLPPTSWRRPPSSSCASSIGSRRRWCAASTCAARVTPGSCVATPRWTCSGKDPSLPRAGPRKAVTVPLRSNTVGIRTLDPHSGPAMMGEMNVRVVLFAKPRELVGRPNVELALPPGATAADAWRQLSDEFHLGPLPRCVRCAVNAEYAQWEDRLTDGDELAVIPPVSGGAVGAPHALVEIRAEVLDPGAIAAAVQIAGEGAGVTFTGIVR